MPHRRRPAAETRAEILTFVRSRIAAGAPPTVREVQRALGFKAVQSAQAHLQALVQEGRLVQREGKARGYALPGQRAAHPVPLIGRVQAGALHEAIEDPDGMLLSEASPGSEGLFALRVQGESMKNAGILPGDIVIVRRQAEAPDGAIVVAMVDDEATVKRLQRRGSTVTLWPENDAFTPLTVPAAEVRVLGKVVEVRRHLERLP